MPDALLKKLKLIDMQSMEDLARNFGVLEKAADAVFKNLDGHWYTFEWAARERRTPLTNSNRITRACWLTAKARKPQTCLAEP